MVLVLRNILLALVLVWYWCVIRVTTGWRRCSIGMAQYWYSYGDSGGIGLCCWYDIATVLVCYWQGIGIV